MDLESSTCYFFSQSAEAQPFRHVLSIQTLPYQTYLVDFRLRQEAALKMAPVYADHPFQLIETPIFAAKIKDASYKVSTYLAG